MAAAAGETVEANLARVATYASIVLAVATIIGCVLVPILAERLGRRLTMALFMTTLGVSAAIGFGYAFYQPDGLGLFMVLTFFMGLGGANFAVYTVWLPELYATDCRASAIGFISSAGRFVGVALVFTLYYAIPRYGSLGVPVSLVASTFVLGLLLLPLARETKGQALPG
jgi:MFS family permease